MKKSNTLKEFCAALQSCDDFLLTCHANPEGDAIGSILALDSLLRKLGKKTTIVCQDRFPRRLSCLSSARWKTLEDLAAGENTRFRGVVLADCANPDRLGEVQKLIGSEAVIFNVDHHISNTYFGHFNYVIPTAAATGEVVLDLFRYFTVPLDKEDATNIYVAISTDTGSFRYGNTSAQSHRHICDLIERGIDIEAINEALYATYSLNKLKLYSRLLARVRTALGGQVAWVVLKRRDLSRCGADDEDMEGFVDMLRLVHEVKIAFVIIELRNHGGLKVSFRSKGAYDVNQIALDFNGGGHKKAAACVLKTSVKKAEKMVLERLAAQLKKGDGSC
jgi:phosphoesterase RecJ-like protein